MNINIYGMWGSAESFEGFYNACIVIHIGCLAFISPKLLEVANQLQNISGLLIKYFNYQYKFKYSLFGVYIFSVSFFLLTAIASLLSKDIQSLLIIPNCILVVISICFSSWLLLRMNLFHNHIINLTKKYKYRTPEKENNIYPTSYSASELKERSSTNIEWNNEILDLWEEVVTSEINKNGSISQICEMIDKGILSFWDKYCEDVENGKIQYESMLGFGNTLNNHIFYPLRKVAYLNQVACINKNDELSFHLINRLICILDKVSQGSLMPGVVQRFEQAIKYKIKHLYFGDYFDMENIASYMDCICKCVEEEFKNDESSENTSDDELGIIPYINSLESIVDISKEMISNYKNILIDERWQKIFNDLAHRHKECAMIIQYANLNILTNFLLLDEYKLVYDYMNYYKNYEKSFKMGWTSGQYIILPLNINFWNYLLDNKWNYKNKDGDNQYSIKIEYLQLFFLCRLKYHIDEKVIQKMYPKHESKKQGKLKLKLSKESIDKFFDDDALLCPWRLSTDDKEYYKEQILNDIELN